MSGQKWRVRCLQCDWRGVRTDSVGCECYPEYAAYCRPGTPGPGCPRGIVWPCPRSGRVAHVMRVGPERAVIAVEPVRKRKVAR